MFALQYEDGSLDSLKFKGRMDAEREADRSPVWCRVIEVPLHPKR